MHRPRNATGLARTTKYLAFWQAESGEPGAFTMNMELDFEEIQLDACANASYEAGTRTVRALLPLALFGSSKFDYVVTSTFGGSFGNNELVPSTGKLTSIPVDVLPPFGGNPACSQ